jgi:hypothetical protein
LIFLLQPRKESADQVQTDARTFGLQGGDPKRADLAVNRRKNRFRFLAAR